MMEDHSTACLVLGILSICASGISFFVCWWLGIVGIIFGIIGVALKGSEAGTITGGIGIGGGLISVIVYWALIWSMI